MFEVIATSCDSESASMRFNLQNGISPNVELQKHCSRGLHLTIEQFSSQFIFPRKFLFESDWVPVCDGTLQGDCTAIWFSISGRASTVQTFRSLSNLFWFYCIFLYSIVSMHSSIADWDFCFYCASHTQHSFSTPTSHTHTREMGNRNESTFDQFWSIHQFPNCDWESFSETKRSTCVAIHFCSEKKTNNFNRRIVHCSLFNDLESVLFSLSLHDARRQSLVHLLHVSVPHAHFSLFSAPKVTIVLFGLNNMRLSLLSLQLHI